MELMRAYQAVEVLSNAIVDTAENIVVDNRVIMIGNSGAQPAYFNPDGIATANSFLIPAGTVFPMFFSCAGNLSVISNATGTTVCILFLDV